MNLKEKMDNYMYNNKFKGFNLLRLSLIITPRGQLALFYNNIKGNNPKPVNHFYEQHLIGFLSFSNYLYMCRYYLKKCKGVQIV